MVRQRAPGATVCSGHDRGHISHGTQQTLDSKRNVAETEGFEPRRKTNENECEMARSLNKSLEVIAKRVAQELSNGLWPGGLRVGLAPDPCV